MRFTPNNQDCQNYHPDFIENFAHAIGYADYEVLQTKPGNSCTRTWLDENGDFQTTDGDSGQEQIYVIEYSNSGSCSGFSEEFTQGQDGEAHCGTWREYRASLTGSYSSVTLSGSNDPEGVTCNGRTAHAICQALHTGEAGNWDCDGNTWRIGNCGSGVEITTTSSICGCPTGYTVRPCINANNPNWGGIGTATCSGPTQVLNVDCR